ncbi:hypothetical protein Leryth_025833 [Lithospermum erythrorhizon]|nr:hypothetical protein Leryth_025833 [Lithospermum erythrorhizon]
MYTIGSSSAMAGHLQVVNVVLWLVLHLYSIMGLSSTNAPTGLHFQANGKSLEDLCEALCSPHGFTWTHQGVFGISQLPGTDHSLVLILFTLADAQTSLNFSVIGVLMVSGALVMDAFVGSLQEAIFTVNPETTQIASQSPTTLFLYENAIKQFWPFMFYLLRTEMLFCSTAVGLPLLILPMILTGELFVAWSSCALHPYVYGVLVFEAMATYVGQVSVLSLIALFGAASTAMVECLCYAITISISYMHKGVDINSLSVHLINKYATRFTLVVSVNLGHDSHLIRTFNVNNMS